MQIKKFNPSGCGKRKVPLFLAATTFLTLIFFIFTAAVIRVMPFAEQLAEDKLHEEIENIINSEVLKFAENNEFNLSKIYKDRSKAYKGGDVLTVDMSEINRVKASLSTQILKTLKDIKKVSVQVPLGGIFSTAKGFRIKAELLAITRFKADIEDDFSSENYSHTRHYIYIKTETEASVLLFGKVKTLKTSAKVPLFEGIIIGETPGIITGK